MTGVKYNYKVTFVKCTGLPEDSLINVNWKRGRKKENHGETKKKRVVGGVVEWNEAVAMVCTLFRKSKKSQGFEEKEIILTLEEYVIAKSKTIPIGSERIDLSEFAAAGGALVTKEIVIKNKRKDKGKSDPNFTLTITVSAESSGE